LGLPTMERQLASRVLQAGRHKVVKELPKVCWFRQMVIFII
jgi:hypothetical protein